MARMLPMDASNTGRALIITTMLIALISCARNADAPAAFTSVGRGAPVSPAPPWE